MNRHASNLYNRCGYRPLPETFDMEFVNHINNTYLDHWLPEGKDQDWDSIDRAVHEEFDCEFGEAEVSRHLKLVRS